MAQPQPERSEHDPTVGGIVPISSLADVHPVGAPPGAVWLTMCAWCHRLRVRDRWIHVRHTPDLIDASGSRESVLTHGICPECFEETTAKADRQRRLREAP